MKKLASIRAVIFDWAGTTVDHGSLAPALAFVEVFRRKGIEISMDESRFPMGKSKREHIITIAALPRVAELWLDRFGAMPTDADIALMYESFIPVQKELLVSHSEVIPGVPQAIRELRRRGIKIGSSTGYSRELMQIVTPLAERGGYSPDIVICSDDVSAGRPAPWLNFAAAEMLGVYPMNSILVVDDTPIGIEAGKNSGAITVAVTRTGNALGLSLPETEALTEIELGWRLKKISQDFFDAGADFVVESAADIPQLLN
jgi:phosphonoacetaldehyde hydrolase